LRFSIALPTAGIDVGITPPSFYKASGSKAALFGEVVGRYVAAYGQVSRSLWGEHLSPREAIELLSRRSAKIQTGRSDANACLLGVSASTSASEHEDVMSLLAKQRAHTRHAIHMCVQRAITIDESSVDSDARVLDVQHPRAEIGSWHSLREAFATCPVLLLPSAPVAFETGQTGELFGREVNEEPGAHGLVQPRRI
jgi:AcrR family transcriptional regulator